MKVSELIKTLKAAGCIIIREWSSHQIWLSPKTGARFSVPRHPSKELPKGTVENIIKAAGLN